MRRYDTQIITVPFGKIKFKTFDGNQTFFISSSNVAIS